jgi:hypothetical protein
MMDNRILGEPHINAILGMEEVEAIIHLKKKGKSLRVVNKNGEGLMVSADINPNRVNVWTRKGVISRLVNLG